MDIIFAYILLSCIILVSLLSSRENYKAFRKWKGGTWYKVRDNGINPITEIYTEVYYWTQIKPMNMEDVVLVEDYN